MMEEDREICYCNCAILLVSAHVLCNRLELRSAKQIIGSNRLLPNRIPQPSAECTRNTQSRFHRARRWRKGETRYRSFGKAPSIAGYRNVVFDTVQRGRLRDRSAGWPVHARCALAVPENDSAVGQIRRGDWVMVRQTCALLVCEADYRGELGIECRLGTVSEHQGCCCCSCP